MLVTAGSRSRCSGDCGTPIEAAELVEFRQGERARHIVCPPADRTVRVTPDGHGVTSDAHGVTRDAHGVTRDAHGVTRDNCVTRGDLANGHAPAGREDGVAHRPVTRDDGVTHGSIRRDSPVGHGAVMCDNGVMEAGLANGHAPVTRDIPSSHAQVRRDSALIHPSVTRDNGVTAPVVTADFALVGRDDGVSHAPVTRDFAGERRGEEKRREEKRGSFASPADGAGAPSVADQADRLLDEYERTILPTLQRIGDGTFTVELDGPSDYVTFTLDAMRDDPEAQRVLPLADSKHPLSHDGEALFRSFAIVRGRRAMPVRRLLSDASPAVQRPLRRLLLGLEAVLRSSEGALSYGLAYARQAGRCFVCGDRLTRPESIERGVGPVCLRKWRQGE